MLFSRLSNKKINLRYFVFETTPLCNRNCIYCYNIWRNNGYEKKETNPDDWGAIISKLKKETKIELISISGGEPLLYVHIFELLQLIKKHKIKINFLTNASCINKQIAKKLVKSGISLFEIPLVAPEKESHAQLTNSDDFEKTIEGIANIKYYNGRFVTVFVATRRNIHLLEETLDLSIALGSTALMFNRINPARNAHIELMPTKEQMEIALKYLNSFAKKYEFPIISPIPVPQCIIDMAEYPYVKSGQCPRGNENAYYTVDFLGNVRICNHSPVVLGNLLKENFSDIVAHEYVEKFKNTTPQQCLYCKDSQNCRGGCKASAEICYGSISEPDPFVKTIGKI